MNIQSKVSASEILKKAIIPRSYITHFCPIRRITPNPGKKLEITRAIPQKFILSKAA